MIDTMEPVLQEQDVFQTALAELQAQVHATGVTDEVPVVENANFLRYFLRAKGNVPDALQMVMSYAQWRKDSNIGPLNYELVRQQLEMGKVCVFPIHDHPTCDVLVIFVSRLHRPRDFPTLTFLRSLIFLMEQFMCNEQEHKGFMILNDMREVGKGNFDFKVSHIVRGLQACVPILPQKVIIYKPPFLFKMVWRIIQPFLTPAVINLMEVVTSSEQLSCYINPNDLLLEYGGTLNEDRLSWLSSLSEVNAPTAEAAAH